VGEAAAGVADLSIVHYQAGFGFSLDGVDDVGGAERHVDVGHVVLMEKRGVVRGDAHAEYADVGVFQDEMMMRLFRDGNGDRRLSAERECEKKQERAEKQLHL
jgi:hypothetical protein